MLVKVLPPLLNCSYGCVLHIRRGAQVISNVGVISALFPQTPFCKKYQSIFC